MTSIKRFASASALVFLFLFSSAQAQTPSVSTVNVTPEAGRIRVSASGDVFDMRVAVSDESGDVVFESGPVTGDHLDWAMRDPQGQRIPAGPYTMTVTYRASSGKLRRRVEQVLVTEEVTAGGGKAEAQAAPNPEPNVAGTGATGKLAKWTNSTGTLGNSVMTESAARIGINTAAPTHTLTVNGGPYWTSNGWIGSIALPNASAIAWAANTAGYRRGIGHTNSGLYFFRTLSNPGTNASPAIYDVAISNQGRVGIGITDPKYPLHVVSNGVSVFGQSTNVGVYGAGGQSGTGVYGSTSSGYGVFGVSSTGTGVYGQSSSGYAGYFVGKVKATGALEVASCTGCTISSDSNLKANISAVNPRSVLNRLAALPIRTWNYKTDSPSIRHIGPMAQDFRSAFQLGADDKHIDMIDANGVTMASVQALYQLMLEKDEQIERLQFQVNQLRRAVRGRRARVRAR